MVIKFLYFATLIYHFDGNKTKKKHNNISSIKIFGAFLYQSNYEIKKYNGMQLFSSIKITCSSWKKFSGW